MPPGAAPVGPAAKVAVLSTGMTERLAEQRSMRRHRLVRRILLGLAGGALVAGAVWAVFYSEFLTFDASRVTVSGTGSSVDAAAVADVVAQHDGTALALVDTGGLREELLAVPNVRDVAVRRQWPAGLDVEIVAREPVAAVPVDGGVALLDQDAVEVDRVPEAPLELPVISIPLTGDDRRTLDAALVILRSLPPELSAEVAGISAVSQDAVTLTLRDGVVVEWGSSQESALKIRVLQTLRGAEQTAGAQVFDLSAPTFPITR